MTGQERILVIKLGALGDVVQALGPMAAIRRHHAGAHIDILTTEPFIEFLAASGYADQVIPHVRMKWHDIGAILAFRRQLRAGNYSRVYDLQTSSRSSCYFHLMGPGRRPEWSGIAMGCSHPHANPDRDRMHTVERQREQLAVAGIAEVPMADLSWANADLTKFSLPARYAILVPGGSPHRMDKWWPAGRYAHLAKRLSRGHVTPILVGTREEIRLHSAIVSATPTARSLAGQTSLVELAAICRGAAFALGNDTGVMHMAAAAGVPSIVLYSHASDPDLCGQRGPKVTILRRADLAAISVEEALAATPITAPDA